MRLLRPEALWLLFAVLPLVALHLRRLKRRVVPVASIQLWRELAGKGAGRTGFRKLREAGALALLSLALVALVGALSDPVTGAAATRPRSLVVVLDGSVTMNARDGDATRFERARAAVTDAVTRLAGDDDVTVWLADGGSSVLVAPTSDRDRIARGLAAARPTLARQSLVETLALARRALDLRGAPATLLAVTDAPGAVALADAERVVIASVGEPDVTNAGIAPHRGRRAGERAPRDRAVGSRDVARRAAARGAGRATGGAAGARGRLPR
jgi:hypothetical protein